MTKATRVTRGPKVASKICEVLASQEVEKEEAEDRRSKAEGVRGKESEKVEKDVMDWLTVSEEKSQKNNDGGKV